MDKKNPNTTPQELIAFMGEYSKAYMACGGPTSRLEDALGLLGNAFGFQSEVFATPTGVFVSAIDDKGFAHTSLCRIKESGTNLERMCWLENIFEDVFSKKISISNARRILKAKYDLKTSYAFWMRALAAIIMGFTLSYQSHRSILTSIVAGFITAATMWVTGEGLSKRISSSIFRDFIGCIVALTFASLSALAIPAPFEVYSIGAIVILAPGLALTIAISELADQNLLSGTARLMQSILTLLAIALAYMLFSELSEVIAIHASLVTQTRHTPSHLLSLFFVAVTITAFCIIIRVPKLSLPWSTLTGLLGWFVLEFFSKSSIGAAGPFLAAFVVGFIGLLFSHRYKVPSQIFTVPGIVALLPGLLALNSLQSFVLGKQLSGVELGFQVAQKAGSIVFGLFMARIPFVLYTSTLDRFFNDSALRPNKSLEKNKKA